MANDVSIIELDGSVNSGNLFLADSQIDHRHLRRRVFENHRQQDQSFGGAPHRFIDVAAESLAESVAGESFDRQPVFYPLMYCEV